MLAHIDLRNRSAAAFLALLVQVAVASLLLASPASAQGFSAKDAAFAKSSPKAIASLTNGILTVQYDSVTGQFTINTGSNHPNPGQKVFFGIGTSYVTLRDATALQVFLNACGGFSVSSAGATGHTLTPMCTPSVSALGSTGFRATYTVPNWRVVQDVQINGTALADTNVSHAITVTNTSTAARQYGLRNLWDWQIATNDASYFRTRNPDGTFSNTFATFTNPAFQFFEEVDNPASPTFTILGTVGGGPLVPVPTTPEQLRYASWSSAFFSGWDFANTGSASDSATAHYWGFASPLTLAAGQSATFVEYVTTQLSAIAVPPPVNASPGVPISAGAFHACAFNSSGATTCWGRNDGGQLGDGTTTGRNAPVAVTGLAAGTTALAAGNFHTCAVVSGAARCWGNSAVGQLGNGSLGGSAVAVTVTGLASGVVGIASGANHSCALTSGGAVRCWGENTAGQLGNGTTTNSSTPVQVTGLASGVVQITAGSFSTCAVTSSGGVKCWGDNQYGELGDGSVSNRATPVDVIGLASGITSISAKRAHACALSSLGGVQCWGENDKGQLGSGSARAFSATPLGVSGLSSGVTRIAAGFLHSCAISGGAVLCWGDNQKGELGDGTTIDRPTPVNATGLSGTAIHVTADYYYTCAETADGGVNCWGDNTFGQVGDGTQVVRTVAQRVLGIGGSGFLDLTPGDGLQPAANTRVFPMVVRSTIDANSATATADIQFRAQDVGTSSNIYVFAMAPANRVIGGQSAEAMRIGVTQGGPKAETPIACVLAQLSRSGQMTAVTSANLAAYLTGVLSAQGASVSILNGVPTSNVSGATFFVGYGASGTAMINTGTNRSAVTVPGALTCQPAPPQTGWWWNPAEDGRGFSLEVRGNNLFFAAFLYDTTGRSTWYVSSGQVSLDGTLYNGDLLNARGGQTLGGPYLRFPTLASEGPITITFNNASTGTLVWRGGTVPIQRFNIVLDGVNLPPVAGQPESGWWWNEAEPGRGFFMEWQNGTLDIAGYMFDDAGNPVWYLTVGPIGGRPESGRSFQGTWWSYANGQTLAGPWRPNTRIDANVAPLSITFSAPDTALMTLPNGRTTSLKRHRF